MFSNAKDRAARLYEASLSPALAQWREESTDWFDGTPDSVDARIAKCRSIQARLRGAAGALGSDGLAYLAADRELEADRASLEVLRRDLLTAAADREADLDWAPPQGLSRKARRWVEAQAREFMREQAQGAGRRELVERARRHAATETSRLPKAQADTLTGAFVARVGELSRRRAGRNARQLAAGRRKATRRDFPDQLMYG